MPRRLQWQRLVPRRCMPLLPRVRWRRLRRARGSSRSTAHEVRARLRAHVSGNVRTGPRKLGLLRVVHGDVPPKMCGYSQARGREHRGARSCCRGACSQGQRWPGRQTGHCPPASHGITGGGIHKRIRHIDAVSSKGAWWRVAGGSLEPIGSTLGARTLRRRECASTTLQAQAGMREPDCHLPLRRDLRS